MRLEYSLVAINLNSDAIFAEVQMESASLAEENICLEVQKMADVLGKISGEEAVLERTHQIGDATYEIYMAPTHGYRPDRSNFVRRFGHLVGRYEYSSTA